MCVQFVVNLLMEDVMTKLLIVGDLHAADKTPVGRTDNYLAALLNKLDQIKEIYRREYAAAEGDLEVVFLGDIFHRKRPNYVSHFLVNLLQRFFDEFYSPPFILIGNHDVPLASKGLEWYPIGSLRNVDLVDSPMDWSVGDALLLFYPGHIDFSYELLAEFVDKYALKSRTILFVHNAISEMHLPFTYLHPKNLMSLGVSDVVFGHIHTRYGPKKFGRTVFFDPGAVMRVSRAKSDLELQPAVAIVDLDKEGLESYTIVELEVEDAYNVFDVAGLEAAKSTEVARTQFIEALDTFDIGSSSDYLLEQIKRAVISDDLKQLIISTLEQMME